MDSSSLQPGRRIFVNGSSNEPSDLLEALRRAALPHNLHFIQFPLAGYNNADFTGWRPSHQMTTMFMGPHLRDADPARLHFVPMHMRAIHDYLSRNVDLVSWVTNTLDSGRPFWPLAALRLLPWW